MLSAGVTLGAGLLRWFVRNAGESGGRRGIVLALQDHDQRSGFLNLVEMATKRIS
jgi:hypothetical protein